MPRLRDTFILSICVVLHWSSALTISAELREFWIQQPLDHFESRGVSHESFRQRYYVDWSHQDGQSDVDGVPILVYIGGEASIDQFLGEGGIVTVAASRLKGLVVYVEHRFYGKSIPRGSIDTALLDPHVRGCLTSDQALEDLAKVIVTLKSNLSIPRSPVITFGGSYAGTVRFRMIYSNITIGSLASSAPILMSANVPAHKQYCYIVSQDFENESKECYQNISRSWGLIDEVASQHDSLDTLSRAFSTCSPLRSTDKLKTYLAQMYNYAAQYNGRFGHIHQLCRVLFRASKNDLLKGIGDAVLSLTQDKRCNDPTGTAAKPFSILDSASAKAWDWQRCNEIVPYQYCGENTMFEKSSFDPSVFSESCFEEYGSYSHPLWNSTIYNGRDLKITSNVIFSNGLMDPYSGASILENISETVISITTKEGSHCLDLTPAQDDDPKWLKDQRDLELQIIARWLNVTLPSDNSPLVWAIWSRFLVAIVLVHIIA